jgi:hypothetical protein
MAHKSKKKHIKHLHQHDLSSNKPTAKKHAGAKADVEVGRVAAPRAGKARDRGGKPAEKRGGIVRSIARAATKKIAAKPKKIMKRATKRVKSLLGRE